MQAMQTLQQRLKLASVKAENGWVDMSINEIETVGWAHHAMNKSLICVLV